MPRWQVRRQWINKAGMYAWVVFLNEGIRPVFIGRAWDKAVQYVNKKIAKQKALTALQRQLREARRATL